MSLPTDDSRPAGSSGTPKALYALMVVGVVVLGFGSWLAYDRVTRLERSIGELDEAVASAEQQAEAAHQRADAAERAAEAAGVEVDAAETRADHEAAGRVVAENAARTAETDAEFARLDADRAAEAARAAQAETEQIRAERDREISRLQGVLDGIAPTRRSALGLVMNLGEDSINFEYDKADLRPEDRELLARIVGVLLTTTGFKIQIFGHTDDVASQEYNQTLSERRAQTVADYLVAGGIDPDIITTRGFGKLQPLVAGTSDEDRAQNRRVELGIIDSTVEFTTEAKPEERR